MVEILSLPDDDEALVLRTEAHRYGFPQPQTLARWACNPSDAPCTLPYTFVGRCAAYRIGDLRRLRDALTFRHSTARAQARAERHLEAAL